MEPIDVVCPCCGEPGTVEVEAGEEDADFVQDCSVCCRPWQVRVRLVRGGTLEVRVSAEGD